LVLGYITITGHCEANVNVAAGEQALRESDGNITQAAGTIDPTNLV
jgi:hypothetical protein